MFLIICPLNLFHLKKKLMTGFIAMNINIKFKTRLIYDFNFEEGRIILTILTIKAAIKILIIQALILSNIYSSFYCATTLIETTIAIVTKNIIVIAMIHANIIAIRFEISFKKFEILSSPTGSTIIADVL